MNDPEEKRRVPRPLSRLIVVLIFLGAGGLMYWLYFSAPSASELVFVLTDVEVSAGGQLLRHEHIDELRCDVLTESGEVVATTRHRRPGAVTPAAELRLPDGAYLLRVELHLRQPDGTPVRRSYLKKVALDGEKVTIHL